MFLSVHNIADHIANEVIKIRNALPQGMISPQAVMIYPDLSKLKIYKGRKGRLGSGTEFSKEKIILSEPKPTHLVDFSESPELTGLPRHCLWAFRDIC